MSEMLRKWSVTSQNLKLEALQMCLEYALFELSARSSHDLRYLPFLDFFDIGKLYIFNKTFFDQPHVKFFLRRSSGDQGDMGNDRGVPSPSFDVPFVMIAYLEVYDKN